MDVDLVHQILVKGLSDYLRRREGDNAPSEAELSEALWNFFRAVWAHKLERIQRVEQRKLAHRHRRQWRQGPPFNRATA